MIRQCCCHLQLMHIHLLVIIAAKQLEFYPLMYYFLYWVMPKVKMEEYFILAFSFLLWLVSKEFFIDVVSFSIYFICSSNMPKPVTWVILSCHNHLSTVETFNKPSILISVPYVWIAINFWPSASRCYIWNLILIFIHVD